MCVPFHVTQGKFHAGAFTFRDRRARSCQQRLDVSEADGSRSRFRVDRSERLAVLQFHVLTISNYASYAIEFMSANAAVRARIDEHIKEEATVVLAAMGLTVSDDFRILLTRVAREKALPFEPLIPNAETIEAMTEARRGRLPSCATVVELMADMKADDLPPP
jgi:DNA-damage-inducible protein J